MPHYDDAMVGRIDRELTSVARRGLKPIAIYVGNVEIDALRASSATPRRMWFTQGALVFDGVPVHHVHEIEHFHVSALPIRSAAPIAAHVLAP